ncbi:MAG: NUDIX domain-containing protein [Treponema sp.]|jgi:ADP-ribose pyrophosphatase YjhB (NUDIX family)|nr:NUDIX domain-containing protein [Treponema sp.]
MFQYCPSCGSRKIVFERNRAFRCPDCGFKYYHNTAAATGCIIRIPGAEKTEDRIMLLVRGKEPSLGKLDLPGGFVDPGEGALDGLRRELREEIGWEPPPAEGPRGEAAVFTLFASFPNVYPYKNIVYNTCDLFFTLNAPGLKEGDLKLEPGEIAGIRFVRPGDISPQDLAFESTRRALRAFSAFWDSPG